jgi:ubiquitin conjugation factor E4 B
MAVFLLLYVTCCSRAGSMEEPMIQHRLQRIRALVDSAQATRLCMETVIGDPDLISEVLAFYRLLAAWLLRLVSPSGLPELPLPDAVPMEWATLPEWFVEDLAEYCLLVTRMYPQVLATSGVRMDDMMLFLVVCIGSPKYLKSPYLRSKMSEVVHAWLPREQDGYGGGQRRG